MKNFIQPSTIQDQSLCNDIIEFHKNSPDKAEGKTIKSIVVNGQKEKESTDVDLFTNDPLVERYMRELNRALDLYVAEYPWSNAFGGYGLTDSINIQHYAPTQGYHAWHTERYDHTMPNTTRHLVFMTYLNDVTEGGETEFFHQNLKVSPRKGLTLIWPADWTFVHRGIASMTQHKYIATGWFNFTEIQ